MPINSFPGYENMSTVSSETGGDFSAPHNVPEEELLVCPPAPRLRPIPYVPNNTSLFENIHVCFM